MKLVKVTFHNDIIEVVENGKYWVSVKVVCRNLGIDYMTQYHKIKSDPTFEAKLIEINTAGGKQKVFCIPLEKLNGWLFTINPNKVKPEVREKLIAYKNECFRVLYNHFFKKQILMQKEIEAQIQEKESLISQLQEKIYHLKNKNANLVRALNTLTNKELDVLQKEARLINNTLEAMYQIGGIYQDLKQTKEELEIKLNRVEIFAENIARLFPDKRKFIEADLKRKEKK